MPVAQESKRTKLSEVNSKRQGQGISALGGLALGAVLLGTLVLLVWLVVSKCRRDSGKFQKLATELDDLEKTHVITDAGYNSNDSEEDDSADDGDRLVDVTLSSPGAHMLNEGKQEDDRIEDVVDKYAVSSSDEGSDEGEASDAAI